MYSRTNVSGESSGLPQVRSALGSLKRTWSGNQHDLGSSAPTADRKHSSNLPGPASSQERFYEWSPSPPHYTANLGSHNVGSDKENAGSAPPEKRVKATLKLPQVSGATSTTSSSAQSNGFVTASTVHRGSNHSTSSYGNPNLNYGDLKYGSEKYNSAIASTSDSGGRATSHPSKSNDLATQFSYDRKQAKGDKIHQSAVTTQQRNGPSGSGAPPSSHQPSATSVRTSSAPSMSWMKTASQLKSERRNDPGALRINSMTPSMGESNSARSSPSASTSDPNGAKSVNKIFLSLEQRKVLQMVVEGERNVFFTGSAGTGKSVLLREIIKELRRKHAKSPDAVAVTASTGIAACNIGGVTIHSFAGIGLGKEPATQLVNKIRKNRKAAGRWQRTKVLIIDEVSMVDPQLLDKLEEIARMLRKRSDRPFGGIQIVITGDFFQLPPVNPGGSVTFAFDADCWNKVVQHKVNLTQVFRQKEESFVTMLNEMRFGTISQKTINAFQKLERTPKYDEDIVPTELFPRREEVDRANMERLNALQTESQSYRSQDGGTLVGEARERVLQNSIALPVLHVKKGAQVMLVKNVDESLVNGSVGKIIDFMDETEHDKIAGALDMPEVAKDGREQVPRISTRKWPLVRFHLANGGTRDYLCKPETWKTELPDGEVQASRTQVPLILAWAMSIHKSQGQTLPCCKINLNRVFEKGQAYVALSRATSLEGLQVLGFRKEKVMAHPRVIQWSKSLIALGE